MAVKIFPEHGLAHVRFEGVALIPESFLLIGTYLRMPEYRPGLKQLIDLTGVTALKRDFPRFAAGQARLVDVFAIPGVDMLALVSGPHAAGTRDGPACAPVVGRHPRRRHPDTGGECRALALLGLREASIADLLKVTDRT